MLPCGVKGGFPTSGSGKATSGRRRRWASSSDICCGKTPVDFFAGLVEFVLSRMEKDVSRKEMIEIKVENIVILCKTG